MCGTVVMILLFIFEFNAYLTIQTSSDIVMTWSALLQRVLSHLDCVHSAGAGRVQRRDADHQL
jgi:hypothetical protein